MTSKDHKMMTMFLKLKSSVFHGLRVRTPMSLKLDYYERVNKLGIVH